MGRPSALGGQAQHLLYWADDLAAREEAHALIADCIAEVNAELALDPQLARAQSSAF